MRFRLLLAPLLLLLPSCMGLRAEKHTYASGGAVEVGGARVGIGFRPEGTKGPSFAVSAMVVGGGFATLDGPFAWRIEAVGEEGVHRQMTVHRIRTRTVRSGRDEWFPAEHLGRPVEFRKLRGEPDKVRARFRIPGQLRVKPEEDGAMEIWVDLSVESAGGVDRETVKFRLRPAVKRADQMVFLPTEIVTGLSTPIEDQEDPMWD